jgi:hypothetical protein
MLTTLLTIFLLFLIGGLSSLWFRSRIIRAEWKSRIRPIVTHHALAYCWMTLFEEASFEILWTTRENHPKVASGQYIRDIANSGTYNLSNSRTFRLLAIDFMASLFHIDSEYLGVGALTAVELIKILDNDHFYGFNYRNVKNFFSRTLNRSQKKIVDMQGSSVNFGPELLTPWKFTFDADDCVTLSGSLTSSNSIYFECSQTVKWDELFIKGRIPVEASEPHSPILATYLMSLKYRHHLVFKKGCYTISEEREYKYGMSVYQLLYLRFNPACGKHQNSLDNLFPLLDGNHMIF